MTRPSHSPQDTLSVQKTPYGHPYDIYDTARPCVIDEEDESHAYDTDDAAPSVNIPRFSSKDAADRARKRSSLPPALSSATTSIYRTANSIISQRTTVSKLPAGMTVRTQFESAPAFEKAPWEMPERPLSMFSIPSGGLRFHSKTKSVMQPRIFQILPREVYACILQQLEVLHFGNDAQSCTTCYLRDLYNLALTSRAWDKAARNKLYSKLWLPPADVSDPRQSKSKAPSRLKLLRKTLRERSAVAKLVVEIKAAEMQQVMLRANYNEGQAIINDLASIVMACPNLEKLAGFYRIYNHEFDRLNHALSTRPNLKERAWIIGKPINHGAGHLTQQQAFELYPGPTELFLHHQDIATNLETLFLHGQDSGAMDFRAFVATFRKLPRLRRLHISNFSASDFNDRTLAALPPTLTSLRLEALDGVTDKGLLRFAQSPVAAGLTSLALVHQEIVDLLIVIAFLRSCTRLESFAIVQDGSPGVNSNVPLFRPVFASNSLRNLHWDILMPAPATDELAISVAGGAFPLLERLRAPCDYDGVLQDLCRPRGCVTLPDDEYYFYVKNSGKRSDRNNDMRDSMSPHDGGPVGGRPPSSASSSSPIEYTRNLAKARRRSQARIDARVECYSPRTDRMRGFSGSWRSCSSSTYSSSTHSANSNGIQIVVENEDNVVTDRFSFDYVGTIGSTIDYVLEPDVDDSLDAVIGVGDLMLGAPVRGLGGGVGFKAKDLCAGSSVSGRWHRSRARVRLIEIGDFF
ncbi:uncharacterized protein LTHEOB_362 [Lasiodiplodia theobromae]|uniref:F-box domain-containing protein n=1 Tax=Lasiodiplodia theobromae TaxID=45133 RepID=A0A5N5DJR0_9PEZI|nr:uncharacterized protein LTHEOB_362 [Lasiodiplodia theobromae]KAB2577132.1 hypothetical protein DBV05_g4332 [Lasiodiplodia theobromae]KAF4543663.1 hypothetical protein LTHEOB_362 [Lasiodiplodia theobromae]